MPTYHSERTHKNTMMYFCPKCKAYFSDWDNVQKCYRWIGKNQQCLFPVRKVTKDEYQ